jgi:hypothetical protein
MDLGEHAAKRSEGALDTSRVAPVASRP